MSHKYVVVYSIPAFDTVWADTPEDAARIVRNVLTIGGKVLGTYRKDGPVPPEFDGFPGPPAKPVQAV